MCVSGCVLLSFLLTRFWKEAIAVKSLIPVEVYNYGCLHVACVWVYVGRAHLEINRNYNLNRSNNFLLPPSVSLLQKVQGIE